MRVTLFMTRGMSLREWHKSGILERELLLYKHLSKNNIQIGIVTYGDSCDVSTTFNLDGISVLCNKYNLPNWIYALLIPLIHKKWLKGTDIIKTNQTYGSDVALYAAILYKKPIIARCGYMLSENMNREHGKSSLRFLYAILIEKIVFKKSNLIVVTTDLMLENITNRFSDLFKKIVVVPNYVDTDLFCPDKSIKKDVDIVYVGRLSPEKNIENLLDAVSDSTVDIKLFGSGVCHDTLVAKYLKNNDRIMFMGNVPNYKLAKEINSAKVFVLPSFYEGHPKSILEAMACGVVVIGTNVSGIREIVKHNDNGLLCETGKDSIASAIKNIVNNEKLRLYLANRGRDYVVRNFGIDKIVKKELSVYKKIINKDA